MRGRSYTPSPPRGGYGRRGRSPSPRGGGRYGRGRSRDLPTSLLVRNLRHDCRQDDLRRSFEQFGPLKDIYLPRDYYTGNPRGFGFVQFVDPADAAEAKYHMDGYVLHGRELTVVFAEENRKKPTEMRARERGGVRRRSPPRYSRSPPRRRGRSRSRSGDYYSPPRRHHPRSISPKEERYGRGRSYSRSPAYNGSRGRSVTPARGKSRSISPSPRRSISRSPRRGISPSPRRSISRSRSPRGDRSPSPRRSISRSPRGNRSPSPRRSRSYTPEQARSRSPPRGEQYEDRSPSQ
ncbi:Serine/arginine-rich SC35-like splicing factor SCL33 [Hirschfeldia incana]|nr:Serine/arginine-rich SC35-like splicing factor SCL33 [Hirschfeldia incana]